MLNLLDEKYLIGRWATSLFELLMVLLNMLNIHEKALVV